MTNAASNIRAPRRFVVLHHVHPMEPAHFDLMIEDGDELATWRVESAPESASRDQSIACVRVADHRIAYLDYEGPISNDRGHVTRHDSGACVVSDLDSSSIRIRFDGTRLVGDWLLESDDGSPDQWRLLLA